MLQHVLARVRAAPRVPLPLDTLLTRLALPSNATGAPGPVEAQLALLLVELRAPPIPLPLSALLGAWAAHAQAPALAGRLFHLLLAQTTLASAQVAPLPSAGER